MKIKIRPFFVLFAFLVFSAQYLAGSVYFQETGDGLLLLGNSNYYEVALNRNNGAIAYIIDKTVGRKVNLGSKYESLWAVRFHSSPDDYYGGKDYHFTGANRFRYEWIPQENKLVFYYEPDPSIEKRIRTKIELYASEGNKFDLKMQIENQWDDYIDYALFPAKLQFQRHVIQGALLPVLPGIVLRWYFFKSGLVFIRKYPGYPGLFADYMSMDVNDAHMAIYTLHRKGKVDIAELGFEPHLEDRFKYVYEHSYGIQLKNDSSWTSPTVRIRVSGTHTSSIESYRIDNGFDKQQSIKEKLGSLYDQVVNSILYKTDVVKWDIPFRDYTDRLRLLPKPGIFHLAAFQIGGFDRNNPDFLPPAAEYGTTEEFAEMFRTAQSMGLLVMPYINPTWWDWNSATVESAPFHVSELSLQNINGKPKYEKYAGKWGFVVSPYHPFVFERVDGIMKEMTEDVPSDLIFEDQIGARAWQFDHNSESPHPTSYIEGWIEHTEKHKDKLLMTELGFDHLIRSEVGFTGSILLPWKLKLTGKWLRNTWHVYPFAPMVARDKILFYQHDLAPETMTSTKYVLTWNMSQGYMLGFDLFWGSLPTLESSWLQKIVPTFQQKVISKYAHERLKSYKFIDDNVTLSRFETFSVTANWSDNNAYESGSHMIAPKGFTVRSDDDRISGGIFVSYNGIPLENGEHYLLEERFDDKIILYHMSDWPTDITVMKLECWSTEDKLVAMTYDKDGKPIGETRVRDLNDRLVLRPPVWLGGREALFYVIRKLNKNERKYRDPEKYPK